MKRSTFALIIIIAILLISLSLVYPVRADIGRSVFSGTWEITFTDCAGNVKHWSDCKVTDIDEVWITFKFGGRSYEVRLQVQSSCSTLLMERRL